MARLAFHVLMFAALLVPPVAADGLPVFGYLEQAVILPEGFPIRAKLDTGADGSSLDATDMRRFRRNGESWVAFTVSSLDGREIRMEKRVLRFVRIRQHSGKPSKREVVSVSICVGGISRETEVNLTDRTQFAYNLLVGRDFMAGKLLVDPSREFLTRPDCNRDG